jgi:hypothetical protein
MTTIVGKKSAILDTTFSWMEVRCPQLAPWRDYALRWLTASPKNHGTKLRNLNIFFREYVFRLNLPASPSLYLKAGSIWPSFPDSILHLDLIDKRRTDCNDTAADFLRWILETDFSGLNEFGDKDILQGYRNPVRRIQKIADRNIDNIDLRAHNDKKLRWVTHLSPELAAWRSLAVEWMAGQTGTTKPRLLALQCFFRELIIENRLPTEPRAFFDPTLAVPDFYAQTSKRRTDSLAKPWTTHLHSFTEWVLNSKFAEINVDGKRVRPEGLRNPIVNQVKKFPAKSSDVELKWVTQARPELETWRQYAAEWLASEAKGIDSRLKALVAFFDRYLIAQNLPSDPAFLLKRNSLVPDFYLTCCVTGKDGKHKEASHSVNNNNRLSEFLDWVLNKHFSIEDDEGFLLISPAFRNPVPYRSHTGGRVNRESVHSPLPFGFIEDMRLMLCEGPNFRDWTWAQKSLGGEIGVSEGGNGTDWFAVNEDDLDKDDPDCVWRVRQYEAGHRELQMWSPVRWVALLLKLQIPLRILQVRLLDSGEADTWRYSDGAWTENRHILAEGTERSPLSQGAFRRINHLKDVTAPVILYVNTNKTADQKRSGPAKGYEVPWPCTGPMHQNPFYWMERLRNWQEKYNPIARRTSWTELDATHIPMKSQEQLATYPNACFLFRMRELPVDERHLPMNLGVMNPPWFKLLSALQERLLNSGQLDAGGMPFVFVPPPGESNGGSTTYFPLQSLRVSLITALALDGLVPFPILQKLVGHSRLLMTLYYTKMGPAYMASQLEEGMARLDSKKAGTIKRFAAEANYAELMKKTVYNSSESLRNVIAEDTGARNPAGWMLLHHGMCVVGGNTSEIEENKKIGGCHNGGPNVGTELQPKYAPVPGGSRNCVQCRFFMTQPQYLPSLVATFNNNAYHFDEARNRCVAAEEQLLAIRKTKFEMEMKKEPFEQMPEFLELERVYEASMKRFSDLAEKLVATWRLIDRCSTLLKDDLSNGNQLIAVGDVSDIKIAFDETESELLQLSGVCEGVEVYPDLEAGKAVFRRSQLLDLALCREGSAPVFMTMSEGDQLACGNAFMRQLAQHVAPTDTQLGMRQVVELMDSGRQVGQMLGIDLSRFVPVPGKSSARVIPIRPVRSSKSPSLESI